MHDRRVPGRHVQNLEVAAEVIAIGDKIRLRRNRDAHVGELGSLYDGIVVRAHEQADVYRIRERHARELLSHERVTETRDRHYEDAIPPLELNDRVRIRQTIA